MEGSSANSLLQRELLDTIKGLRSTIESLQATIEDLRKELAETKEKERLAIILGNEGNGLPEETIVSCDSVVRIPMDEGVDSLNVAAASAVAFWELRR